MIGNFVIFGDSYSTHKEHIPSGYAYYYSTEGAGDDAPKKMLPEETWWGLLCARTGANLVRNDSWSGSTIGYTGYNGDCSTTSSFICRYKKLYEEGFFDKNKIDTVIVFGGTNDSWSNAPLGGEMFQNIEEKDLFCALPAICYFMQRLTKDLPQTKIVFLANCNIKAEIVDCMKHASEKTGALCVELSAIDKGCSHPTILGMRQICDQLMDAMKTADR